MIREAYTDGDGRSSFQEFSQAITSAAFINDQVLKESFGVYDGHGGSKAAEFVAEKLHLNIFEMLDNFSDKDKKVAVKEGYLKTDEEFLKQMDERWWLQTWEIAEQFCVEMGLRRLLQPDHNPAREDGRRRIEDKLVAYFSERMISGDTLRRNAIMQKRTGDHQIAIAFPYRRNGELISCKYRDSIKRFWQEANTEKIFYGLDDIKDASDIIIVGGEMDKLVMEEAGFKNCVSVLLNLRIRHCLQKKRTRSINTYGTAKILLQRYLA